MIDRNHTLSITRQAGLLNMSRGAAYYLPRPVGAADLLLMRQMDELHLNHPFMGARQLSRQLWQDFREKAGHKIYPYLLRKLSITQANQVWALDTTYIPMSKGFVYLTAVVDVASRRVLAHKTALTLEACHAVEVLEQAIAHFGSPQIVNTDQGSQFTDSTFTAAVLGRGCQLSMDGKGAWRDNVFVERLWRTPKYERVYLRAYDSVSAAREDIAEGIDWYNQQRPHSSLQDKTPVQTYLDRIPKQVLAA